MLQLEVPSVELFDDATQTYSYTKALSLTLEHSLVSLSKWESMWCKPFLTKEAKTRKETIDYIRCMTITQNVDPKDYDYFPQESIDAVCRYIELPMTATTFAKNNDNTINREIVTAEIIYYWMVTFNIPFECQKWHLNRLLTLINVCNLKNQTTKKMSKKDILAQNRILNAQRRKKYNSAG